MKKLVVGLVVLSLVLVGCGCNGERVDGSVKRQPIMWPAHEIGK